MLLAFLLLSSRLARASVTVYTQQALGAGTQTAAAANYTAAAYDDPTVLTPPPVPSPAPPTQFSIQLNNSANAVQNLSIPLSGGFLGFSVEFSVINQVSKCQFFVLDCVELSILMSKSVGLNS